MKTKLNMEAVSDFSMSLGLLMSFERPAHVQANPRQMMMTYAVAGDEGDFDADTRAVGMDMVVLGFEPGREREGPTNIAVYEERNGEITAWRKCSPWVYGKDGPFLLMVDGRDFGFAYDGRSLVMNWDVPTGDLEERVAGGRKLLRLMTQCIPPHTRIVHKLAEPIRVVKPVRRESRH